MAIIKDIDASEANKKLTLYWLKPLKGGPPIKGSYYASELRPILEDDYRHLKRKNIVARKKGYVQVQFEGTTDEKYRKWVKESDIK